MKKTIGLIPALTLALAAFIVGVGVTWLAEKRSRLDDVLSVTLAHELETAGLCANGLTLNRAGDHDRLVRLLEYRLDSAVSEASKLTDQGIRLGITAPNLRESVGRAAAYYSSAGEPDRQKRAENLLAKLKTTSE